MSPDLLPSALDYLGAKEVPNKPGVYAWKRPEYDCWVTSDRTGTIDAAKHHKALDSHSLTSNCSEEDYCLAADNVTCMPFWWTLLTPYAVAVGSERYAMTQDAFLNADFPAFGKLIEADYQTGDEVPM